jgi:hypothetical protein
VKRQLTIALACLCLATSPTWAANGNIQLSFDEAGALCQGSVCNGPATIYVYALLQGASGPGITGAEYGIGIGPNVNPDDPAWQFFETFPPGTTVLGRAFSPPDGDNSGVPRGVNIAFSGCQTGDGVKVLLETVVVLGPCPSEMLRLVVQKHGVPANNQFQCPLFTLCDSPTFTKVCLGSNVVVCRNPDPPFPMNAFCSTSGEGFLNPPPGFNCTVGVQPSTWSTVKSLYGR